MLNEIYQAIDPVAFSLGPLEVRWYGLAYMTGFLLAGLFGYFVAKRWKLNLSSDDVMVVLVGAMLGVLLGARLGYVIFYGGGYYLENPAKIIAFNEGGMSFHGALVGAVVGGYIAARSINLSFPTVADLAAIGAPVGLLLGRISNFINGELWGKVTDVPWGVVFETGGPLPRHPSQLYEAFLEGLVLFLILYFLSRKKPPYPQGTYFSIFLILYGIFRFIIEFVRVPDQQLGYLFGSITMGQMLSLPLIVVGVALLIWSIKRGRPQIGKNEEAA